MSSYSRSNALSVPIHVHVPGSLSLESVCSQISSFPIAVCNSLLLQILLQFTTSILFELRTILSQLGAFYSYISDAFFKPALSTS